jgi:hypothetical protein
MVRHRQRPDELRHREVLAVIRYHLVVVAPERPMAERYALLKRIRPSVYVRTLPMVGGFEVCVSAPSRPFDDAHVVEALELARSLAMITEGTLFDPITSRVFATSELAQVDAHDADTHVTCIRERAFGAHQVASRGMVKFGLPELRYVIGPIGEEAPHDARAAAELLVVACTGMVGGVYPEEGTFDMLGETFQVVDGGGVALLERLEPRKAPLHSEVIALARDTHRGDLLAG